MVGGLDYFERNWDSRDLSRQDLLWKLEIGNWKVESGKWKVESGKWKVESGKWKVESGKWKVESGRWRDFLVLVFEKENQGSQPRYL